MLSTRSRITRTLGVLAAAAALAAGLAIPASAATPEPTPPPVAVDKSKLPPTDLTNYPKLAPGETSVEKGAPEPPSGDIDDDVTAITTNADGDQHLTLYTPAPGVTAEELRASLRASGVKGVQNREAAPAPSAARSATDCTYGNATAYDCPPFYWPNNGFADPRVRFIDHTSSAWPVSSATYTWNQAPHIDSVYQFGSCTFQAGTHCVDVFSGNYGATQWQGLTTFTVGYTTSNRVLKEGAQIQLNDYYPTNANGHRTAACHEQGHALTLGHDNLFYGCMWYQVTDAGGYHNVPSSDDFNMLGTLYSVAH